MSEAKKITNKYRLEQWTAIIHEQISSGKRVNEWCIENNLSRDRFYYWLRKVKLASVQNKIAIETPVTIETPQLPKVVPLIPPIPDTVTSSCSTAIVLRLNGVTLEIQEGASDLIIERTLKALQRIC